MLVLGREGDHSHLGLDLLEDLEGLAFGMQIVAGLAMMELVRPERDRLRSVGDRRQIEMHPVRVLFQHVADQVVDMDTPHKDNDHVVFLAIQSGIERSVEQILDGFAAYIRHGIGRLDRGHR